jgi:hypothetical protein
MAKTLAGQEGRVVTDDRKYGFCDRDFDIL